MLRSFVTGFLKTLVGGWGKAEREIITADRLLRRTKSRKGYAIALLSSCVLLHGLRASLGSAVWVPPV